MNYVKKLVFVILCTLLLAACAEKDNSNASNTGEKSTTESDTASSKNELVIAVNENFISMDPHNTGDTNSSSVQETMLEGLLGFDADGQIMKVLADDYSISEDALEYTFKLQEGVTFHDGEQFNAEAVKANIERIMNDESLRLYSRGFSLISKVEILGDYEIKVTLKEPYGPMITRFGVAKMISPKMIKEFS